MNKATISKWHYIFGPWLFLINWLDYLLSSRLELLIQVPSCRRSSPNFHATGAVWMVKYILNWPISCRRAIETLGRTVCHRSPLLLKDVMRKLARGSQWSSGWTCAEIAVTALFLRCCSAGGLVIDSGGTCIRGWATLSELADSPGSLWLASARLGAFRLCCLSWGKHAWSGTKGSFQGTFYTLCEQSLKSWLL